MLSQPHLLLTILSVIACSVFGNAPYFPIEISRIAATGYVPDLVFKVGVLSAGIGITPSNTPPILFMAWFWLSMVAVFDDRNYYTLHMIALALFGATCALYAWQAERMFVLAVAASIFAMRFPIKLHVLYAYEIPARGYSHLGLFSVMRAMKDINRDIQQNGCYPPCCSGYVVPHIRTMAAFQLSGLLQWISFAVLSFIVA